jgi:glycosyltransferase involved in cell wall biosynthesis
LDRYSAKRVVLLKAGVNTDDFDVDVDSWLAEKEKNHHILFIGRGVYKRGVDILLRAFSIFNACNMGRFTLHVVGVHPSELPQEVRPDPATVRFYPYLDRNVPDQRHLYNELLKSARLFVFPMRPGPLPGAARQAQLNCTPVIMSNFSNAHDIVSHGRNGLLVESLEPGDYAAQMHNLLSDAGQWRRLARGAHASANGVTWSNTARSFLELLDTTGLIQRSSHGTDGNTVQPVLEAVRVTQRNPANRSVDAGHQQPGSIVM